MSVVNDTFWPLIVYNFSPVAGDKAKKRLIPGEHSCFNQHLSPANYDKARYFDEGFSVNLKRERKRHKHS